MSRWIDADAVMERERMAGNCRKCKHYISSLKECAGGAEMTAVCHFLTYTHGADVAPVRHGKWMPHPTEPDWDVCSVCGIGTMRRTHGYNNGAFWDAEESYLYCPHCGARINE